MLNLQQNRKNAVDKIPQNVCKLYTKFLLSDTFNLQNVYPTDLVNTKTTIPLRVGEQRELYTSRYILPYSHPLRGIVVYC